MASLCTIKILIPVKLVAINQCCLLQLTTPCINTPTYFGSQGSLAATGLQRTSYPVIWLLPSTGAVQVRVTDGATAFAFTPKSTTSPGLESNGSREKKANSELTNYIQLTVLASQQIQLLELVRALCAETVISTLQGSLIYAYLVLSIHLHVDTYCSMIPYFNCDASPLNIISIIGSIQNFEYASFFMYYNNNTVVYTVPNTNQIK